MENSKDPEALGPWRKSSQRGLGTEYGLMMVLVVVVVMEVMMVMVMIIVMMVVVMVIVIAVMMLMVVKHSILTYSFNKYLLRTYQSRSWGTIKNNIVSAFTEL